MSETGMSRGLKGVWKGKWPRFEAGPSGNHGNQTLFRRNLLRLVRQWIRQVDQHLFRADLQEVCALGLPIGKDSGGVAAAGFGGVLFDQVMQLPFPMRMGHGTGQHGFSVHEILGHAFGIIDIGHPASHARTGPRTPPPPPVMYPHPFDPQPSTTTDAPEFRTANRSPARPEANR